ncbi:hypothetical protein RCZ01_01010 [Capnocytophaga felis]|uniref:Outer membrane protein Omp28 n=2 Tax=Capnocytophaga felis TaxID=2267611 RepID=A0A5M4B5I5_9FLAO|nr:hypothetical protein RCZ01_01010 [Capnocytophaga felis]GET48674.1 hypothetical protein RCZ02_15050 [Capnocytophaga felis]
MASFLVTSCSKEDDSSKETDRRSEIVKEEISKEEETPNQGGNSDENNSNQENNTTENNSNQDTNSNENNTGTNDEEGENTGKMFVYKAYLEYLTGSWCSVCPRVAETIEKLKTSNILKNRFVDVAIHSRDHMGINKQWDLEEHFGTLHDSIKFDGSLIPWFRMNRNQWQYGSSAAQGHLGHLLKKKPHSPIGIKITSTLGQTNGKVSVNFKFKENLNNLKFNVFIVEDKFIAPQNMGRVYQNKQHMGILREVYGNVSGNDLGNVTQGQEILKTDLPVSYDLLTKKLDNVRIVVFVTDANTKAVLNVQEAKANETKEYQYAE